jgi:tRNA threonylcarbamoyladenosine biosynthesis protein TsaE
MKQFFSASPEETEALGAAFAASLKKGDVVALEGDLGAGKTAFTRGILAGLGYKSRVTSPTFSIVNEYPTQIGTVCHFDMYRILSEDALYDIGWEDYLDGEKILIIEWSENIRDALPETYQIVTITYGDEPDSRSITIKEASSCCS